MIEKQKNKLIKVILLAVIILLIFLHFTGILIKTEDYLFNIFTNGQNKFFIFISRLKNSFINYQEGQNLKKENEQLKEQINQLIYENSQLNSYKLENEELRTVLNFKESKKYNLILAEVIGKDIDKPNTLLINKGIKDGIKEGYPVIINNGIIIGKIINAKDFVSTILFITDNLSKLTVSTEKSNKSIGLAEGEFGLSIKITYIPQDLEIKEGDLIITSGTETTIPRGFIVGALNRIISQENELFKSASLIPLVDYNEIILVSVVIPNEYN
ncbi:MAG: rod shape-determining protein MreC [Candidatus Buchananbacteria bacterium RBG_13_36_9]|uniref:Cell shape-determining protein MreC n=1 Tax=Candidatus Buchananbacteria bacterium RBG_13_36_9 TaxID=1797530 RepID=A0A1G1XQV2_9BACT|nr:MAG: rod shape-determining protein MreC [Candidatus Buchananbacteria bacterium RBG_13_36_9]